MSEFHSLFARRLKKARGVARLSQKELADRAGVSGEFISRMERGITLPAMETFAKLCTALSCPPNALLADDHTDPVTELEGRLSAAPRARALRAIEVAEAVLSSGLNRASEAPTKH